MVKGLYGGLETSARTRRTELVDRRLGNGDELFAHLLSLPGDHWSHRQGCAADKMGQLLCEWGIDTAMISAGQSTILPIGIPAGFPGWPVTLSNTIDNEILTKLYLADKALSASGLQKGLHIINPRTDKPAKGKLACWATAKPAAVADALSTAFMVMSLDEIEAFCESHADTSALIIKPGRKRELIRLGCRIESGKF